MFASIFGFISVLIGGIVLFTVSNTMGMAVVERTVEIGTLRAIGLRRRGIRMMFVTEGFVLGCFGVLLGISVAVALSLFINQLGLTWVAPGRVEPSPLAVRVLGEYPMMIGCGAALLVVSALSAIVPASRAARMNIVDALRHV
jgi:putative ABC transport system permease protein